MALIRNPVTIVQVEGGGAEYEEQANDYGTTAIIAGYTTEANTYGQTAITSTQGMPEDYPGPYTVTANGTVPCSGKRMTSDLTVNVESNSGVILILDPMYGGNTFSFGSYTITCQDDPSRPTYGGVRVIVPYLVGKPLNTIEWTDPYTGNYVTLNNEVVDLSTDTTILKNGDVVHAHIESYP